jgi:putative flippase GtrA
MFTQTTNRLLRLTAFRFGLVGLAGEVLYFVMYGLVYKFSSDNTLSLALAGATCIAINAYSHSRFTFRVKFSWSLLWGYMLIQLTGFSLAFLVGLALEQASSKPWIIAVLTYVAWAGLSFLLTQTVYRNGVSQ